MPIDSVIASIFITGMFVVFIAALYWGWRQAH
jgi:hypothetical protein